MLGGIGKFLNLGNIVSSISKKMFPGAGGNVIGGVLGGITNFFSGNPFGAIGNAMQALKGIGQGFGNLSGSKMPTPPMGGAPFNSPQNSLGINQAAAGGPGGFTSQMKAVMNSKMTPEQKKMKMLEIQEQKDLFDQMIQTLTAMQKRSHDTNMAVIRNLS